MNFVDVWIKDMESSGRNSSEMVQNQSNRLYESEFENDPSFKMAILIDNQMVEKPLKVREINVEKTTKEKRFLLLPKEVVNVGSYITIKKSNRDITYLVFEYEDNQVSSFVRVKECNQTLNWKGLSKPIPCWCDNSSYGVKGEIDNSYISVYDGKIQFFIQKNDKTKNIRQNMRFMFDGSLNSVYEVVDISSVTTPSLIRLVMNKIESSDKDDIVNNIAYNKFLDDTEIFNPDTEKSGYDVKASNGDLAIRRYNSNMFTIESSNKMLSNNKWNISIDYNGNSEDNIKIIELTDSSIKIKNIKGLSNDIILIFDNGIEKVTQNVRLVS